MPQRRKRPARPHPKRDPLFFPPHGQALIKEIEKRTGLGRAKQMEIAQKMLAIEGANRLESRYKNLPRYAVPNLLAHHAAAAGISPWIQLRWNAFLAYWKPALRKEERTKRARRENKVIM